MLIYTGGKVLCFFPLSNELPIMTNGRKFRVKGKIRNLANTSIPIPEYGVNVNVLTIRSVIKKPRYPTFWGEAFKLHRVIISRRKLSKELDGMH